MLRSFALMVLSLVFVLAGAGRVEAAVSHCVKLATAEAQAAKAEADAPACHKMAKPAADHGTKHAPASPHHGEVCLCLALAKAASEAEAAQTVVKVETLPWGAPAAIAFISNEPAPERPPPRA